MIEQLLDNYLYGVLNSLHSTPGLHIEVAVGRTPYSIIREPKAQKISYFANTRHSFRYGEHNPLCRAERPHRPAFLPRHQQEP